MAALGTEVSRALPLPAARQMQWQSMERNAFIHFGPNTFTDKEWGEGKEDPKVFHPTDLDCEQWVRELKAAGFKGIVFTAKHHDGFCLWPTKLSSHSVKASDWRNGKGDVLKDLSIACRKYGMKLGVYLSPWDRNHPAYGTEEYNQVFAAMLKEVLTQYGPIFEVWFDGANGEGPNGKKQTYDWPLFIRTVRKYQPNAVIFSDAGPDVRWVGNEEGFAGETCWSMIPANRYVPGTPHYSELTSGNEKGELFVPAESDVSIRPGWFYHASQDQSVKSPEKLLQLYEASVGRNSLLLLNVPPNREGKLSRYDLDALQGMNRLIRETYGQNLAARAKFTASSSASKRFRAQFINRSTWASSASDSAPVVTLTLPKPTTANRVVLAEDLRFGQKVKSFALEALAGKDWIMIASATTIGHKRILSFDPVTASAFRLLITDSRDRQPTLRTFTLHHYAPPAPASTQ